MGGKTQLCFEFIKLLLQNHINQYLTGYTYTRAISNMFNTLDFNENSAFILNSNKSDK